MDRYKKVATLLGSLVVDVAEEQVEDPTEAASGTWDSLESPVPEPALEFGVLSSSRAIDKKPQGLQIDATAEAARWALSPGFQSWLSVHKTYSVT